MGSHCVIEFYSKLQLIRWTSIFSKLHVIDIRKCMRKAWKVCGRMYPRIYSSRPKYRDMAKSSRITTFILDLASDNTLDVTMDFTLMSRQSCLRLISSRHHKPALEWGLCSSGPHVPLLPRPALGFPQVWRRDRPFRFPDIPTWSLLSPLTIESRIGAARRWEEFCRDGDGTAWPELQTGPSDLLQTGLWGWWWIFQEKTSVSNR